MGLGKLVQVAALALATGCAPMQMQIEESPRQTISFRVTSIDTLAFKDLALTPIEPLAVRVLYELEDHPKVDAELFERALPFVSEFYRSHQINIEFVKSDKLQAGQVDNVTEFGLVYSSPEGFKKKSKDIFESVHGAVRPNLTLDSAIAGEGTAILGFVHIKTSEGHLVRYKNLVDRAKEVHQMAPQLLEYFPLDVDAREMARVIAHELGHIWGLYHTMEYVDDGMPNLHNVPGKHKYGFTREMPNLMGYEKSISFEEPFRLSFRENIPLGAVLTRLQTAMIHNRLQQGIVHREVTSGKFGDYILKVEQANGLTYDHTTASGKIRKYFEDSEKSMKNQHK
jgi:hypothetical protein